MERLDKLEAVSQSRVRHWRCFLAQVFPPRSLTNPPQDVFLNAMASTGTSGLDSWPRCSLGGEECAEPLTSLPALA